MFGGTAQPSGNVAAPVEANGAAAAPIKNEPEAAVQQPGEEHEDRSGPTRQARCEINDEPAGACSFTPVLGDGSFDIDTPDRQLRIVVDGAEAVAFERIGTRRVPLPGVLRRDPQDRACWAADDADAVLTRVCAR